MMYDIFSSSILLSLSIVANLSSSNYNHSIKVLDHIAEHQHKRANNIPTMQLFTGISRNT